MIDYAKKNTLPYRNTSSILLLLGSVYLCFWLVIKYELLWGLNYTTDIFLHTQISKSFFQGRGLFWDNVYAPDSYIHSYFLLLLLAPFTFIFGSFGLPLAHTLFNIFAWHAVLRVWRSTADHSTVLIGLTALLGPLAFWCFDDPAYGWHVELLMLPLGILLGCTLIQNSKLFYLWAVLLVLVREDAAVLACAIHTSYLLLARPITSESIKKACTTIGFWVLVFAAGILVLKLFGTGSTSRQEKALTMGLRLIKDPNLRVSLYEMYYGSLFLLTPLLILFLFRGGFQGISITIMLALPIVVIISLASFAYLPKTQSMIYHGSSWPYRFAMLWCLLATSLLFSKNTAIKSNFLVAVFCGLSLYLQNFYLQEIRDYKFVDRLSQTQIPLEKLSISAQSLLNCLGNSLPHETSVTVSGPLTVHFNRHDWNYGKNSVNAWKKTELIVCDLGLLSHDMGCREQLESRSPKRWKKHRVDSLELAYLKKNQHLKRIVRACL